MRRIRLEDAEVDQVVLVLDDDDKDAYMQLVLVLELPDPPETVGMVRVGCMVKILDTGAEIFMRRETKVLSRKRRKYLSKVAGRPDLNTCLASFHNKAQAEIATGVLAAVGIESRPWRSRTWNLMNVVLEVRLPAGRIDHMMTILEPWFNVKKAVVI